MYKVNKWPCFLEIEIKYTAELICRMGFIKKHCAACDSRPSQVNGYFAWTMYHYCILYAVVLYVLFILIWFFFLCQSSQLHRWTILSIINTLNFFGGKNYRCEMTRSPCVVRQASLCEVRQDRRLQTVHWDRTMLSNMEC